MVAILSSFSMLNHQAFYYICISFLKLLLTTAGLKELFIKVWKDGCCNLYIISNLNAEIHLYVAAFTEKCATQRQKILDREMFMCKTKNTVQCFTLKQAVIFWLIKVDNTLLCAPQKKQIGVIMLIPLIISGCSRTQEVPSPLTFPSALLTFSSCLFRLH